MKLFISYSHKDAPWAKDFWRAVRDAPLYHEAWLDERIVPATDWWHSILSAIESCDCFVMLLSLDAVSSIYCTAELDYAIALNKPILPLMLRACTAPEVITRNRVQFKDITTSPPMDRVLLIVSSALTVIQQTTYDPKPAARPNEPKPRVNPQETLQLAEDALEKRNYTLAEKLLQDALEGGAKGVILRTATRLLQEVKQDKQLADEYTEVRLLHEAGSKRMAAAAWQEYYQEYGSDYDPAGLNALYGESRSPTSAPPPKSAELEYMTRWKSFTGKRNSDWQPYMATFKDMKIPAMEFCLVPPGTFQMGSDDGYYEDETPVHPQTLRQPYWLAQYPVTNAQWQVAVNTGVVKPPEGEEALAWYRDSNMANCPVVGMTWFQAKQFCAWLGCRLPTELEWEYAARGVDNLTYPWGNTWDDTLAVWHKSSGGKPNPVTSKPEGKAWVGAQHLSGNVWEWTRSLYKPYPYQAGDGREADTGDSTNVRHVLRGGSWNFLDDPYDLRAACRLDKTTGFRNVNLGIRCVRS